MKIRDKLALAFALLFVAGLTTSIFASYRAVREAARERLESDVNRATQDFQRRVQELRQVAELQVGSVVTQSVYAEALSRVLASDHELGFGATSHQKLLEQEQRLFEEAHELFLSADLLPLKGTPGARDHREIVVVVSGEGKLVYNDARPDMFTQSLLELRIVKEALTGHTAADLWSSKTAGLLAPADADGLFLVLAQPVQRGKRLLGAVLLGQRVNASLLPEMEQSLRGAKVVLQANDKAVAALLSDAHTITGLDAQQHPVEGELEGTRYLVRSQEIRQEGHDQGPLLGRVFVLLEFERELQASINVFWRSMLLPGLATLLGAMLATSFLSRWLADPLVELEKATRRVQQGDLTVEVSASGKDEVARLAGAFNEMVSGLRQRDQIKGLFKRYLNPAVVEELIQIGRAHV